MRTRRWTLPITSTSTRDFLPHPLQTPVKPPIDAALYPSSSDYYYYALGKDGKHHFSKTLAEHNAFLNSDDYAG